ncbi:hypothetical protein ACLOJK_006057 [Asimina triloba]
MDGLHAVLLKCLCGVGAAGFLGQILREAALAASQTEKKAIVHVNAQRRLSRPFIAFNERTGLTKYPTEIDGLE